MTMKDFFWFGASIGDFIFKGYKVTTTTGLVTTCLGIVSLAILFESIKVRRVFVNKNIWKPQIRLQTNDGEETGVGEDAESTSLLKPSSLRQHRLLLLLHQTGLHVVEDIVGYLLMLSVMTYNTYIALGIFVGSGLGYFIFGIALSDGETSHIERCCPNEDQGSDKEQDGASLLSSVAEGVANVLNAAAKCEGTGEEEQNARHVVEVHNEDGTSPDQVIA